MESTWGVCKGGEGEGEGGTQGSNLATQPGRPHGLLSESKGEEAGRRGTRRCLNCVRPETNMRRSVSGDSKGG